MKRLALAAGLCLALSGCSSPASPEAELQTKMNAITTAANNLDAAALRAAADDFLALVRRQSANADITTQQAQDLQTVAARLLRNASKLEEAEPSASPSSEPSPSPQPSPSPSPSPEPSPSPSPSPTEAPPSPDPLPSVQVSASPAGGLVSPAAVTSP